MKKTLIISGGTGGLGMAISEYFARKGYNVAILYNNTKPRSEYFAVQCKLQDGESVKLAVQKTLSKYGRIDVCIHCAVSPIIRKKVIDFEPEEFRNQFEVGFFGGFNLFKYVALAMKSQKSGHIIGITTTSINDRTPNMGAYIVSKIAMRGLLRELSEDLKSFGVNVNAIAPGFMLTKLTSDLSMKAIEIIKEKYPEEITSPENIAKLAYYLCKEKVKSGMSFLVSREAEDL